MPARILVVDDNRTNLDLMLYLLRAFGHEPVGMTDAVSALEVARREPYDLVLSDILMPKIDGYEFARRFRATALSKDTKLVAVTALAMVGDRDRALAAGFDGYIAKPIDPQTFVSQIDQFLADSAKVPADPRVLVIDDNAVNRLLVATVLAHAEYMVLEAADGFEGLRMAKEYRPDLIILDLHMPGMNGPAFVKSLRADPELSGSILAIYTGTKPDAMMHDFMELYDIKHIIPKPSEPEEMLSIVREALSSIDSLVETQHRDCEEQQR